MTTARSIPPTRPRGILRPVPIVGLVAFVKLGLLLFCASAYGYFRDELYFLACAHRLAWGYVDRPPFSIALLAFATRLYGETLLSVRLVPALAGTVVIILTARLARRFGARPAAQGLAALSVLVAPALLGMDHVYSMGSFEVLFCVAAAGLLARALEADPAEATLPWIRVGLILGIGAMNSLPMLAFAAALYIGMATTSQRTWLRRGGPWLALAVMSVVFAPYVVWERAHGWPTLGFLANEARAAFRHWSPLTFAWDRILGMGPVTVVVWVTGVVALLRSQQLEPYRLFGVAFVLLFVESMVLGARGAAGVSLGFPIVVAAGAAALDPWLSTQRGRYPVLVTLLCVSGAIATPLMIPLFRVQQYQGYARMLGLGTGAANHDPDSTTAALPQRFADMYGWPEMVRAVANVVDSLPPLDREDAVVLASNDGEAGALELFGGAVGLPKVISGHDQYWPWGTAGASGRVVVAVGGDEARLRASFRTVDVAAVFGHSLAMPFERRVKIYVCRDSVEPLDVIWPSFKVYD